MEKEKKLIQRAGQALKANDKNLARQILESVIAINPNNDQAWMYLAFTTDDVEQGIKYLQRALEINPANDRVKQMVEQASSVLAARNIAGKEQAAEIQTPMPPLVSEQSAGSQSSSWDKVWIKVLTKPSVATFAGILREGHTASGRAYTWIIMGTLIGMIARWFVLIMIALSSRLTPFQETGLFPEMKPDMLVELLYVFMVPFLAVFGLWFHTHITQWVARMFGGTGTYVELVYLRAAYLAPISIIANPLNIVPIIGGFLSLLIILYLALLDVIAVKTVNRFSWVAAIAAVILPSLALGLLFVCVISGAVFLVIMMLLKVRLQ